MLTRKDSVMAEYVCVLLGELVEGSSVAIANSLQSTTTLVVRSYRTTDMTITNFAREGEDRNGGS